VCAACSSREHPADAIRRCNSHYTTLPKMLRVLISNESRSKRVWNTSSKKAMYIVMASADNQLPVS
jgi:hypothetical protein